ncbi:hypothetical protein [Tsukamurella paurometabola]|uniref:Uncharacterized protein n=1 Tax=Tsukamurella paurometabola TaxID=2061 RepID=A0ABS5NI39_TSUPA|nr:hypothetical protein [Tsukamurella paurometabola]MBS4103961.1 hypothetical protein [Tsukamurella paurometabola]
MQSYEVADGNDRAMFDLDRCGSLAVTLETGPRFESQTVFLTAEQVRQLTKLLTGGKIG